MIRSPIILAALMLLPAPAASRAPIETPPLAPSIALAGYVTDAAHVLDDRAKARLATRLRRFEQATHHQLVVVTVPTLGGQDVKGFTTRLGNAWGIGRRGANDGIVVLVAPSDREARIAVGYGLERVLTDSICDRIMAAMVPYFRVGDIAGGLNSGIVAITTRVR